jgi:hypothetical protein
VGKKDSDSGWASSGDHLEADPATFRGYGENIAKLRLDFQNDIISAETNGTGRDNSVSTGMYEPGSTCGALVDANSMELQSALRDLLTSLTAIPAACLTMGDLFDSVSARGTAMINAQADAMAWAFATKGAERPAGVPPYIKGTIQGAMKEAAAGGPETGADKLLPGSGLYTGASVATYSTVGGGKRYVVHTPDGNYVEWGEDADGNRTYEMSRTGDGPMVTTTYKEGEVDKVTKRYEPTRTTLSEGGGTKVVDEQQVVKTYNSDGKLTKTTTDHVVVTKYSDDTETHRYYTEEDGKKTNDRTVGRQPEAVTAETWKDLAKDQSEKIIEKARGL